ncbi:MAG: hypothetical protein ACI9YU_000673 [Flavobacteriales bacterium]|jgi:hypothetical protein
MGSIHNFARPFTHSVKRIMFRLIKKLIPCLIIVSLFSCGNRPLKVDLSDHQIQVKLHRSETLIFNHVDDLESFGEFLPLYGQYVLGIGHPKEMGFNAELKRFTENEDMRSLFDKSETLFSDGSSLQKGFDDAFSYYHYHFPENIIPQLVTNISGLNYAIFLGDTTLGIGLDMFLGSDFEIYPLVSIPVYMSRIMTDEYVVSKSMYGWIQGLYESEKSTNMLEQMVFHGKILYSMDAVLYGQPDSIKSGFSDAELAWCTQNEFNVWSALIDKNLLYTNDHMSINKWIEPAPFTSGLPQESPGQLGRWVGWQMVRAFMQRYPETTIPELFNKYEAQQILTLSKYKPK